MDALLSKITVLKRNQKNDLSAVEAALYEFNKANVRYDVPWIVELKFLALIAENFTEAAELLPFFNAAINELSATC
jgi:hypothetical protein